jgi:hypothetical protein
MKSHLVSAPAEHSGIMTNQSCSEQIMEFGTFACSRFELRWRYSTWRYLGIETIYQYWKVCMVPFWRSLVSVCIGTFLIVYYVLPSKGNFFLRHWDSSLLPPIGESKRMFRKFWQKRASRLVPCHVGVTAGYGLDDAGVGVRVPAESRICPYTVSWR